jgi:hypothetical protein
MAINNQEHIDNLFREGFDRIEIRYNPEHWQSLEKALADVSGHDNSQQNLGSERITNKSFPGWWLSVFAGLILGALYFFYRKDVIPVLKPKVEAPIELRDSVHPEALFLDTIAPGVASEFENDFIEEIEPDSVRGRDQISADSLSADSIRNDLDLFIFW